MSKKQFKAESKRLLDLMINSIYTHKEIFLRELISNGSDAIDKLCYLSLTDDKVGMNRDDFEIRLTVDKENRTLTVSDNGIGMDEKDLENNLGIIASSGSLKFRQEMEGKDVADTDIIGRPSPPCQAARRQSTFPSRSSVPHRRSCTPGGFSVWCWP